MSDLLLAFYGDDFTGSTDVIESLEMSGVRSVLFIEPPTTEMLARFPEAQAVGMAGLSRTMSPGEMDGHLPECFAALGRLRPRVVHYKTCSTFDSSPTVGSIGRAIDLGRERFAGRFVPLLAGAPTLGRYCVFGNLFARSGLDTAPFRLDRHPTMSKHPVTPMDEADLRLHLAKQTTRRVELLDVLNIDEGAEKARQVLGNLVAGGTEIVLMDVLTREHEQAIGELVWSEAVENDGPLFVAGSSGLEYALTAHWRAKGMVTRPEEQPRYDATKQIVVVSGSCSPVTERQTRFALARGFQEVALDTPKLAEAELAAGEIERAVAAAVEIVAAGASPIVHTSLGPDDPRLAATMQALARNSSDASSSSEPKAARLSRALAEILRRVLRQTGLTRACVTGGDTSGFVAREIGVEALEFIGPVSPGSPLCKVHAADDSIDGLEIVFKGGQVGHDDFLVRIRDGQWQD